MASTDLQRAYQFLRGGQFSEALELLEPTAAAHRKDEAFQTAIANAYFFTQKFEQAAKHFQIAARVSASVNADTLEKLAFALHKAGRKADSIEQFAVAFAAGVRSDRFVTGYRNALATYVRELEKAGHFVKIKPLLKRWLDAHPEDPFLLSAYASECAANGELDPAIAAAERAAKVDLVGVMPRLASLLISAGRPFDVFPLLLPLNAAGFKGFIVAVNHLLAKALSTLDREEVAARLGRLDELHPQSHSVKLQIVLAAIRDGRTAYAKAALERFDPQVKTSHTYLELAARLALISGDADRASALLNRIWDDVAERWKPSSSDTSPPAAADTRRIAPLVYMPLEIKQREFEPRVLTACFLAEQGISSALVAWRNLNTARDLPPGIILNKTLNSLDCGRVARLAPQGHLFAALDEEAIAWTGNDWEMLCGVDAQIVSLIDLILLPGQRHKEAYDAVFPQFKSRTHVTGNPRLDLLKHSLDQAKPGQQCAKYGDFVLVCTNFAATNSALFGFADGCRVFLDATTGAQGDLTFERIVEMGKASAQSECYYFRLLNEVMRPLAAAFPDLTFVLRAHPGESDAIWKTLLKDISNVVVDSSGPLQSWLPSARALIHMAGCATGLEAHLAGVPAIRLAREPEMAFPKFGLSHRLNAPARDADQAVVALRRIFEHGPDPASPEVGQYLAYHISQTDVPAARKMADALARLHRAHADDSFKLDSAAIAQLKTMLGRGAVLAEREAGQSAVAAAKRVTFDVNEVGKLCTSMADIFDIRSGVEVSLLSDDAVLIRPRGTPH